jgi:DNA-binding SARP family transcriptional activator/ABC-type transport system substrate-binding protein
VVVRARLGRASRVEFRILGPVELGLEGRSVALGGPKQRAVLALLLLSANRVVSRDRLIQELWPDHPRGGADHALKLQISRLRKALSAIEDGRPRLITRPPGYVLRVEPGELDLYRFEQLVAEARQALDRGDAERAADRLRSAESLWRGRPLADLEFEPFARVDVERLEDLRLAAVELRIDAELALGKHRPLVSELEALIAEYPLRERLRAQLMRALYADARQAEALAVYTDTRRLLVDELGIEPSEELRELERRVLNQDPELRRPLDPVPARPHPSPGAPPREPGTHTRGRVARWLAMLVGGGVIVAVTALLLAGGSSRTSGAINAPGNSVVFFDPGSGRLTGQIGVGPAAGQMAFGAGAIWKLDERGELLQIEPKHLQLVRSIPVGIPRSRMAIGDGGVWIAGEARDLVRVNPAYGTVDRRIHLPGGARSRPGEGSGIAIGAESIWVIHRGSVLRIDPEMGRVEHRFRIADADIVGFSNGSVWVASSDLGMLTRIDPGTDTVAAIARIGPWICCLAVGGGYAWAANDTGLWKLAGSGDPVANIKLPTEAGEIAYGGGALWASAGNTVLRVDGQTDGVRRYRFDHLANGIATDGRQVAVSLFANPQDVTRHLGGRVLRAAFSAIWFDVTDPAVSARPGAKNWATEQQLQYATCGRLMYHPSAPSAGRPLAPDLAAATPGVTPDGHTYTFRIRAGLRFSPPSNAPVTAQAFKYSIERALSPRLGADSPAVPLASDIVGLDRYRAGRAAHISGIRATGNVLSITLARRAPDLPERISATYFCAVPIGTPVIPGGLGDPIPSAGPYYLSANLSGVVAVLRRNPNYHGNRPRRLDAVVFREEIPLSNDVARIEAGKLDYAAERGPPLAPDTPLARRHGTLRAGHEPSYLRTPLLGTDELAFNTTTGPFANSAARRAVTLALDRSALAAALGDLVAARYLPPGMPGYVTGQIHPRNPAALRAARALLRGRTTPARLAVCSEPSCLALGRSVRAELARIGIKVHVVHYSGDLSPRLRRPGADIVLARVLAPYPDPVAFLKDALGLKAGDRSIRTAAALAGPARLEAAARVERSLLRRRAPAAAFGTPAIPEFFSSRVGCKAFPRVSFGADLGALCLDGN